jgi:hypothetical protein
VHREEADERGGDDSAEHHAMVPRIAAGRTPVGRAPRG